MSGFYSMDDYYNVEKHDVHTHVLTYDPRFIEQSRQDHFSLISINVDVPDYPSIEEQRAITKYHADSNTGRLAYATSFKVDQWSDGSWEDETLSYLKKSFQEGAVAVKVWKNIGMELLDKEEKFVMIDHPRFDPILDFISKNDITLIGHLGEPFNCWLPLDQMTVDGDKNYFKEHPEYHMYLHPEYPSYQDQIDARDHMLEKHPDLRFVGAHLGSLEYSVDELAKRLDRYPNMAVDMAERISHLQHQAVVDSKKVRDFVLRYQDRLLYGTDLVDDGTEEASKLLKHAHEVRLRHWEFFCSDHVMQVPKVNGTFTGLKLPREVIDKIYSKNAEQWFPGLLSAK
jgi:hypothetical protein